MNRCIICAILTSLMILISGCSTAQTNVAFRPMQECKNLCLSSKVNLYKDETITCKCNLIAEVNNNE